MRTSEYRIKFMSYVKGIEFVPFTTEQFFDIKILMQDIMYRSFLGSNVGTFDHNEDMITFTLNIHDSKITNFNIFDFAKTIQRRTESVDYIRNVVFEIVTIDSFVI